LGARGIHLRFLSPLGHARRTWRSIGYRPEEFLAFYREGLEACIEAHREGPPFFELIARVFLAKILHGRDLNYMDLRSPCGAGIGQLAYDHDGTVYPCDEARLLRAGGDDAFRLGPAAELGPREAARHPTVRALTQASLLDSQAHCSACAYKPFCGVCPVLEYAAHGDLFGRAHRSMRCRVYMGVQDLLFRKLEDPASRAVLEEWARPPGGARPDPLERRS
ncbi:MAG: SPASM domain-containing protein, partial [Elusimicrobia bacterium]|nr:SPASM domain-containing protein [Elusimicrobiota bacterium]